MKKRSITGDRFPKNTSSNFYETLCCFFLSKIPGGSSRKVSGKNWKNLTFQGRISCFFRLSVSLLQILILILGFLLFSDSGKILKTQYPKFSDMSTRFPLQKFTILITYLNFHSPLHTSPAFYLYLFWCYCTLSDDFPIGC